jgi:hypothetical protein
MDCPQKMAARAASTDPHRLRLRLHERLAGIPAK